MRGGIADDTVQLRAGAAICGWRVANVMGIENQPAADRPVAIHKGAQPGFVEQGCVNPVGPKLGIVRYAFVYPRLDPATAGKERPNGGLRSARDAAKGIGEVDEWNSAERRGGCRRIRSYLRFKLCRLRCGAVDVCVCMAGDFVSAGKRFAHIVQIEHLAGRAVRLGQAERSVICSPGTVAFQNGGAGRQGRLGKVIEGERNNAGRPGGRDGPRGQRLQLARYSVGQLDYRSSPHARNVPDNRAGTDHYGSATSLCTRLSNRGSTAGSAFVAPVIAA